MKRGEIYYVDFGDQGNYGCEQGGLRPCLIIQNNVGNRYSPTVIVALITSSKSKADLPVHVKIHKQGHLPKDSIILAEQIRTIDKARIKHKIAQLNNNDMVRVDKAIKVSLDI